MNDRTDGLSVVFDLLADKEWLLEFVHFDGHGLLVEPSRLGLPGLVQGQLHIAVDLNVIEKQPPQPALVEPAPGPLVGGVELRHLVDRLHVEVVQVLLQLRDHRDVRILSDGEGSLV